jgi:response regulator RpfG family c-di-GMP phosphodiesterase
MRHINLESVETGQVLGKSIYTNDGRPLLLSGVSLTPGMINKLTRIGVTMIYIIDKQFEDVKIEDVVSDETRRMAIVGVADVMQSVQKGKDFDNKAITQTVKNIIEEILRNKDILLQLSDVRTNDNYVFIHSINVCIMATVIGSNMSLNSTQLKDLAMGALLHDIGKVLQAHTDEAAEEMGKPEEQHTWIGYNLLRKKHEFNLATAHVALQHHEHVDGTGKPRGIGADQIHLFAKIVAVANYYDQLISDFLPGPTYPPYEASEHLMGLAGVKFDHQVVIQFLRSIALYPTGTSVKLSTGDVGVVVGQHKGLPSRPVIRIFKKDRYQSSQDHNDHEVVEIDLSKETTVFINNTLDS